MDLKIFYEHLKLKRTFLGHELNNDRTFFRHHCSTKVNKTCPHSYLNSRKARETFGQD